MALTILTDPYYFTAIAVVIGLCVGSFGFGITCFAC
jgi:hypothetical protein